MSLVCKLTEVEGRPAVKLSDNYSKALGPADEVERYRRRVWNGGRGECAGSGLMAARAIFGPAGKQGSAASVSQDKIDRAEVELDRAEVRALAKTALELVR